MPDAGASILTRVPLLLRYALSLGAGLSFYLAQPGWDLHLLAPVGVGLLALATAGASVRHGAALGLASGLVSFGPLLWWSGMFVGRVPWLGLTLFQSAYLVLLGAVSAWVQGRASRRRGSLAVSPVSVALLWAGVEVLRSNAPYGGFPWVRLSASQGGTSLVHWASIGGASLVTVMVALTGTLLAWLVVWAVAGRGRSGAALGLVRPAAAAGGIVMIFVVPLAVAARPYVTEPSGQPRSVRVLLVQGNLPRAGLDFNAKAREVLSYHVSATDAALASLDASWRPDLILWPENSADIDPLRDPLSGDAVRAVVDRAGAPIAVGAVLAEPATQTSNTVLVYVPGQPDPVTRYTKMHPVPFAEYIPQRTFWRRFSPAVDLAGHFAAGPGPNVVDMPLADGTTVPVGIGICFEVAYDGLMRDAVRGGAGLLFVPTNNGTFGRSDESVQQLALSRLRAVEHGRTVLHVANVGVSAVITPDGEVHDPTEPWVAAYIAREVTTETRMTLAAASPIDPQWVAATAALVVVLLSLVRKNGRTPADRADR